MTNSADEIRAALADYPNKKNIYNNDLEVIKNEKEDKRLDRVFDAVLVSLNDLFEEAAKKIASEVEAEAATVKASSNMGTPSLLTEPRRPQTRFVVTRSLTTQHNNPDEHEALEVSFQCRNTGIVVNNTRFMPAVEILALHGINYYLRNLSAHYNAHVAVILKGDTPHDTYPNERKDKEVDLFNLVAAGVTEPFDLKEVEISLNVENFADLQRLPKIIPQSQKNQPRYSLKN